MTRESWSRLARRVAASGGEVAVDVVLDDHEIVLLGQLQHPEGGGRREVAGGGVVQHRVGEEQARLVVGEQGFEGLRVGAVGGAWNAQQGHAVKAQVAEQVPVAGVVHQHAVAGLQKVAADDVEGLVDAIGEDDLAGRGADADFGQAHLQLGAQRCVALGRAVAHRAHVGASRQGPQRAQHAGFVEPAGGQAAGADEDARRVVRGHFAHQPGGVDGPLDGFARFRGARRQRPAGHVEARPALRVQVAGGDQPVVGFDDGEARHVVGLGKPADRRQARAGVQDAVVDAGADGGDDLVHQRGAAVGGEGDLEHGGRVRCNGRATGPDG